MMKQTLAALVVCCFAAVSLVPVGNAETELGSVARGAALEFLDAHGVAPSAAQREELARLDSMPLNVQESLVKILAAFQAFEAASSRGMSFLTVERASGLDETSIVVADDGAIASARDSLLAAIGDLRTASSSSSSHGGPQGQVEAEVDLDIDVANQDVLLLYEFFKATIHPDFNDPENTDITLEHDSQVCVGLPFNFTLTPALNIDFRNKENIYVDDYILSVDTCGDDVYLNNGGGNGLRDGQSCLPVPAAALVDLGGDDTYGNSSAPRGCGANGGGVRGAGFLFDVSGDDDYFGGGGGTNGGTQMGSGFLLDLEGDDFYSAAEGGTNGGCNAQGRAALVDFVGNDVYLAAFGAVNGGAALGCAAVLFDGEGTDSYTAGTAAVNGGATFGGLGLLLDRHGMHDTYFDLDGGSGTDKTVIGKGTVGAQLDLPFDV